MTQQKVAAGSISANVRQLHRPRFNNELVRAKPRNGQAFAGTGATLDGRDFGHGEYLISTRLRNTPWRSEHVLIQCG
jgi:hypothetical protein